MLVNATNQKPLSQILNEFIFEYSNLLCVNYLEENICDIEFLADRNMFFKKNVFYRFISMFNDIDEKRYLIKIRLLNYKLIYDNLTISHKYHLISMEDNVFEIQSIKLMEYMDVKFNIFSIYAEELLLCLSYESFSLDIRVFSNN